MTTDPVGADPTSPQHFHWLVNDFTTRVSGVVHATLVSADGFLLAASDGMDKDTADSFSAIVSTLLSLTKGASELFHYGHGEQLTVRLQQAYLLFMAIGKEGGLAVLAARDGSELSTVAYEMTKFVRSCGHVLTADVRADLRRTLVGQRQAHG
jgi:predicted regulator of Ras-like GTPase activity (Roadblock/LC7/MglB family)